MGLFDRLRGKKPVPVEFPATLGAVTSGIFVPMDRIPDEVFSTGVLGTCCGLEPEEGRVVAPVSGKVTQVADTLHAVGLETGGMELLIHVGIDTVDMNGRSFSCKVKVGQSVEKGQELLTMDLEQIRAAGHPTTIILAVTNSDDFSSVEEAASGRVAQGGRASGKQIDNLPYKESGAISSGLTDFLFYRCKISSSFDSSEFAVPDLSLTGRFYFCNTFPFFIFYRNAA